MIAKAKAGSEAASSTGSSATSVSSCWLLFSQCPKGTGCYVTQISHGITRNDTEHFFKTLCVCVVSLSMRRPNPKAVKYYVGNPGVQISWLTLWVSLSLLLKVGFKHQCAPRLVTTQTAQSQTVCVSFSKSDSARGSAFLASSQVMLLLLAQGTLL